MKNTIMKDQLANQLDRLNGRNQMDNKKQYQPYEHDDRGDVFDNRSNANTANSTESASFEWPERFTEEQRQLIGAEICNARQNANMSQTTLGRFCNLTMQQVSAIENGNTVRIDKATIKRIGHYLKKDFNDEIMYICAESNKPAQRSKSIIASTDDGRRLDFDVDHTVKIKGHNFEFQCTMGEHDFKIVLRSDALVSPTTIYSGKKSTDSLFLEALIAVSKKINKGM